MDKSWMNLTDRVLSTEYAEGVRQFLELARNHASGSDCIRCPCRVCCNNVFLPIHVVESHLFISGMNPNYKDWIFHGEEEIWDVNVGDEDDPGDSDGFEYIDDIDDMLHDIRAGTHFGVTTETSSSFAPTPIPEPTTSPSFEKLLDDARRPFFVGCTNFSKLSFIVKLLHIKTIGGWSIKSFDMLLKLLRSAFPNAILPNSYEESRSLQRGLGFNYNKIHACPNDCILYWKENANKNVCPKCNTSRWMSSPHKNRPIPQKVLRHFPLKPRLQRLYMSKKIATNMRWHKEQRSNDHINLRHPADSEVWQSFDTTYTGFAEDPRNVRLGLASDGFNPFNNMAKPYSIWPVILVPYNLPPWSCMKDHFFITSLIIPGPKSPGNEIDIYLQPLIDELNDLWENGVPTYDASKEETFILHAALMWTINDFPAYGNLSGWSTKGKLACPSCNAGTESMWLHNGRKHCYMGHRRFLPENHNWRSKKRPFNGKEEHRIRPKLLSGFDISNQLQLLGDVQFGKFGKKRKRPPEHLNWTKSSIFFNLPYWSTLKLRHNLDVMHIEKNICDNILGTLMNIPGKTKDNINSRRDLSDLGIRKELHLRHNGDRCTMPHACFTLYGDERKTFCQWLSDVKFPDGFAANIARCVSVRDCKISGLKSHDCHVFMQRLLPIAVGGYLRNDIKMALIELSNFFKELCARTPDVNVLAQLEADIVVILCKLEMIFPPSFFDVMIHLAVHLPREALLAGPVQYRWMYPFERYLGKFKRYVKNKARPEGSIAEAYIQVECLTFCSIYLNDVETRFDRPDRNVDAGDSDEPNTSFSVFSQKVRPLGMATSQQLDDKLLKSARWYVLNNCTEIGNYLDEHYNKCKESYPNSFHRIHEKEFPTWLKKRVQDLRTLNSAEVSDDLYALACGPDPWIASYAACIVNGKRFHTKQLEQRRRSQNSGVFVIGDHQSSSIDFYGVVVDVVALHYMGWRRVYLFKCDWYDVGDRRRGIRKDNHITSVNTDRTWYKDEPFVLACQASQCFYIKDTSVNGSWHVVQKFINRNVYDIPTAPSSPAHDSVPSDSDAYQEEESADVYTSVDCPDVDLVAPLHRDDVETSPIDATEMEANDQQPQLSDEFINDADLDSVSEDTSSAHEQSNPSEEISTDEDEMSD